MDLILYHGQGSIDQDQYGAQAHAVVMQLLRPYYYKGHALYLDNWYSSNPLADDLFKKKVSVTRSFDQITREYLLQSRRRNSKRENPYLQEINIFLSRNVATKEIY